jgi:hypothetical protein
VSEGWIQPRLNDARWTMKARERLQRLSWFMHRLKEPLSLGRQGRHPRRPRDRRGQADRLSACRSGITGSTASDRRRRDGTEMERPRIGERHACVTDRVVMHVFSYPGYVTASELEHPASQWGCLRSPGIAARSEPSHYKWVKAMHVFANREKAGAQCVSFPLIGFGQAFRHPSSQGFQGFRVPIFPGFRGFPGFS